MPSNSNHVDSADTLRLPAVSGFYDVWSSLQIETLCGAIWERAKGTFAEVEHLFEKYLIPGKESRACGGYDLLDPQGGIRLARELSAILADQGIPATLPAEERAAFDQFVTDAVQVAALVQAITGSSRGDIIFLRGSPEPDMHIHQSQLFAFGQYRFGTRFANAIDITDFDGFLVELKSNAPSYSTPPHTYVFAKGRVNGDPASSVESLDQIGLPHCSDLDADGKRIGVVAHCYYSKHRPSSPDQRTLDFISSMAFNYSP